MGYNKKDWIFYGRLKRHLVQVYHFVQTGRVMIRLNTEGLLEEMLVPPNSSQSFSFFIDDELCELKVVYDAKKNTFDYIFEDHRYSTSRLGRWYKQQDWLDKGKVVGIILLALAIISPIAYAILHKEHTQNQLLTGMTTTAQILNLQQTDAKHGALANYHYIFNQQSFNQTTQVWYNKQSKQYESPNGLPIKQGSSFEVLVEPDNPKNNRLLFDHPTDTELVQMKIATRNVCVANSPNKPTDQALMYCDCQIRFLYELYGIESLAYLYHQQTSSVDNPHYNLVTYGNFMTRKGIREVLERCNKTIDNEQ